MTRAAVKTKGEAEPFDQAHEVASPAAAPTAPAKASQKEAHAAILRIGQRRKHLPAQLTPVAGSDGNQLPPKSVGKTGGKPGMRAYLPRGKPFRYLSANAVKVHLWLLRRHDRAVPPTGLETEYTLYGECTIADIGRAVKMLDRTVYRALDELVDFDLIRR